MATAAEHSSQAGKKFVLSVDVGSTTIRCFVVNHDVKFEAMASRPMEYERPQHGYVELSPDLLWDQFVTVVKEAMENAKITADQVSSLGISVFRGSFTMWNKDTGELLHNLISWLDTRTTKLAEEWNNSLTFRAISKASKMLHGVTRRKRFLAAAVIEFQHFHLCIRVLWTLQNVPGAAELARKGKLMFGTMDTYLIWRLSGKKVHATDYSNASCTALYDTFLLQWSSFICNMLGLPMSMLPKVKDTSSHFCTTDAELFGAPIEVRSVVADQQSSLFGQCCWEKFSVKCTMGTGTFVQINTADYVHASSHGIIPMIGWSIDNKPSFVAEGIGLTTGSCIDWAKKVGWFDELADLERMASSVPDSNGVCFVPALDGLNAPIRDPTACCALFGLTPGTTREHIIRAILESFCFRVKYLIGTVEDELSRKLDIIRMDGGVSQNNFVLQTIADLTGHVVQRAANLETTALGVAFFAGLSSGFWTSREEISDKVHFQDVFKPNKEAAEKAELAFKRWMKAVDRSTGWYST